MKVWVLAGLAMLGAAVEPGEAQPFLIQSEVGQPYAAARAELMKNGNLPMSQSKLPHRSCTGHEDLCAAYPELGSCAVDQPLCRFEWKAAGGDRFYIITSSGAVPSVVVKGMNYEDPQEVEEGLVE